MSSIWITSLLAVSLTNRFVTSTTTRQPNFIFVITDDQDVMLDSVQATPAVLERIGLGGITMENAFASSPVCCASRTETLAGRTFHNIEATKLGETSCQHAAAHYTLYDNSNSLFQKFNSNGYLTGAFGKVVNNVNDYWCDGNEVSGFDRIHISCQYDDFYGLEYYNKDVNDNIGTKVTHTLSADVYQTTMMSEAAVQFVDDRMEEQYNSAPDTAKPFIIWLGPYAPHTSATPAEHYAEEFDTLTLLQTPNYNQVCPDHHAPVSNNQLLGSEAEAAMLQLYKDRLRSLKSVDDMVDNILDKLDEYDDDNTYIIYTSDHGYQIGQYAIPCGKMQPYDVTTRIPLYIKGPGISPNIQSDNIVGNIDFLPTMLDLANIEYDINDYDGRSMKNILFGESNIDWRDTYLLEFKSVGTFGITHCPTWYPDDSASNPFVPGEVKKPASSSTGNLIDNEQTNNWRVLRIIDGDDNLYYAEFYSSSEIGFTTTPIDYEFFNLGDDPWQMNNIYDSLSDDDKSKYNQLLQTYGQCSGAEQCSPTGDVTYVADGSTSSTTSTSSTGKTSKTAKGSKAMKDDTGKVDNGDDKDKDEDKESTSDVYKVIIENIKELSTDKDDGDNIYVQIYGYGDNDEIKVLQTESIEVDDNLEWNDQTFIFRDDEDTNGEYIEFKFKLYQNELEKEDGADDNLFIDYYLGKTDGIKTSDIKECDMNYSKEMKVIKEGNDECGTLFVTVYKDC